MMNENVFLAENGGFRFGSTHPTTDLFFFALFALVFLIAVFLKFMYFTFLVLGDMGYSGFVLDFG